MMPWQTLVSELRAAAEDLAGTQDWSLQRQLPALEVCGALAARCERRWLRLDDIRRALLMAPDQGLVWLDNGNAPPQLRLEAPPKQAQGRTKPGDTAGRETYGLAGAGWSEPDAVSAACRALALGMTSPLDLIRCGSAGWVKLGDGECQRVGETARLEAATERAVFAPDEPTRRQAAQHLWASFTAEIVEAQLAGYLADDRPLVRYQALRAIWEVPDPPGVASRSGEPTAAALPARWLESSAVGQSWLGPYRAGRIMSWPLAVNLAAALTDENAPWIAIELIAALAGAMSRCGDGSQPTHGLKWNRLEDQTPAQIVATALHAAGTSDISEIADAAEAALTLTRATTP